MNGWLAGRIPPPPRELADALGEGARVGLPSDAGTGEQAGTDRLAGALAREARARLDRALARPGRVRASAFALLAADALFTYACEAAVESEDPQEVLKRIEALGAGP